MRLLVTGGAGFIGSHYVRSALAGEYGEPPRITVLDKLTYAGNLANLAPVADDERMTFVQGDICDGGLLADLLPGHDAVINFAAETHVDRSITGAADFVVTNVVGAQTLFDACLQANTSRVVHIGTDEVYGSIESGSWTEDSPLLPNSPYSAAKAGAELLARAYHRTYGLNISTTRCSNNYGPYQYPEKVIPLFVTNLIDGLKVPLYGDGRNVRDWLHVADHCSGVQVVLEQGVAGESYNIGGGEELANRDLTALILQAVGAGEEMVERVPDRLGHDLRYSVDDSKLRQLGYAPQRRFTEGLAETVDWYRANEKWWRPLKAGA
ncbi:MAG: dTDP-glucose 4,6-dehydratase [Frankiales bacterium]|nr:dTDP-glucose 4,6-dehydratase [Frankiales bacterium]MDX6275670.1 dTDP-glucose 4,6-dehydratase [Frankiales bacterium]